MLLGHHCCSQRDRHCLSALQSTGTTRTLAPHKDKFWPLEQRPAQTPPFMSHQGHGQHIYKPQLLSPSTTSNHLLELPSHRDHLHRGNDCITSSTGEVDYYRSSYSSWMTTSWSEQSLCWSNEAEAKEAKTAGWFPSLPEQSCTCGLKHGSLPGCAEMLGFSIFLKEGSRSKGVSLHHLLQESYLQGNPR